MRRSGRHPASDHHAHDQRRHHRRAHPDRSSPFSPHRPHLLLLYTGPHPTRLSPNEKGIILPQVRRRANPVRPRRALDYRHAHAPARGGRATGPGPNRYTLPQTVPFGQERPRFRPRDERCDGSNHGPATGGSGSAGSGRPQRPPRRPRRPSAPRSARLRSRMPGYPVVGPRTSGVEPGHVENDAVGRGSLRPQVLQPSA